VFFDAEVTGVFMFLLMLFIVVVFGSFPATWLLMLFLGNLGANVSFWGALPGGILITFFIAGSGGLSGWRSRT
jgi:uncharacterized membrane protein AbrB (regulator of aidB expression)